MSTYPREHAQIIAYIDLAYQHLSDYIHNPDVNDAVSDLFQIRYWLEPYMYTRQECRLTDQIRGYINRARDSLRNYDTYSDISIALNYINSASTTLDFMCPSRAIPGNSTGNSQQVFREYPY